ncbi:MAG: hypothetical protein HYV09_34920 [Deltaproteobacteria bacterium]|nr:hypothetical protein [Deltaproteobacteria bacterium]
MLDVRSWGWWGRMVATSALFGVVTGCGGKTIDAESSIDGDAATSDTGGSAVDATPVLPPATGQKLLFEAGYVNYAWGFTYGGTYVTADGAVYRYSYRATSGTDPKYPPLRAGMSEEEITAKYASNREVIGKVDPKELSAMYALVTRAEEGALLQTSNCADAGDRTYVAFRYDAASKTYSPVILGGDGDRAIESTAPAGKTLSDWLAKLGGDPRDSCAPMPRIACTGCTVKACSKSWEVAACDGSCTSPMRCADVSSCAACGTVGTCVLDASARAHCSSLTTCRGAGITCECGGDELCAGGKAWCRGSATTGFRCQRP